MAKVRLHGQTFSATPIEQLPNGNWRMTANEYGARFVPGTVVEVEPNEIVEMAAAETPDPRFSQAALEAAMAEERKTLTPVKELLAKAKVIQPKPGDA